MSLFVKDESAICCLKCDFMKQVSPQVKNQNVRSIVTDKVNNEENLFKYSPFKMDMPQMHGFTPTLFPF